VVRGVGVPKGGACLAKRGGEGVVKEDVNTMMETKE